ncbi:MAG: amino acid permease [Candidatus Nanopelagicales bacterium]
MSDSPAPGVTRKKVFGVTGLAIFTFSFLANVNTTPQLATFGLGSIVLFLAAIVLFLGPTAMASAEMGSTWPRTGGIYVWTRLAFGEAAAFMIIWLEFANFVVAWPGIMGTLALQAAYPIDPNLSNSPAFLIPIVVLVTWLAAAMALRGLRVAKGFAWYSVIAGTLIPAVLLVGFAVAFLVAWQSPCHGNLG